MDLYISFDGGNGEYAENRATLETLIAKVGLQIILFCKTKGVLP